MDGWMGGDYEKTFAVVVLGRFDFCSFVPLQLYVKF
jgi:hypothetical protein